MPWAGRLPTSFRLAVAYVSLDEDERATLLYDKIRDKACLWSNVSDGDLTDTLHYQVWLAIRTGHEQAVLPALEKAVTRLGRGNSPDLGRVLLDPRESTPCWVIGNRRQ